MDQTSVIETGPMGFPLVKLPEGTEPDGKGVSCQYYSRRYSDERGLKMYFDPEEARTAYRIQRIAAKKDLAPDVGRMVEIQIGEDEPRLGYETERAQVPFAKMCEEWQPRSFIESHPDYQKLRESLREIGLGNDLHPKNWGFLRAGALPLISGRTPHGPFPSCVK